MNINFEDTVPSIENKERLRVDMEPVDAFAYGMSQSAVEEQAKNASRKIEVALAEAYATDAVAVDIIWYYMALADDDANRMPAPFDIRTRYEGPPDERDLFLGDDGLDSQTVSRVERYDLTQTSDEEFRKAMEQSEIDFSRLEPFVSEK